MQRNNYKEISLENIMGKRGQLTIFVIVALVIVAVVIAFLIYRNTGVVSIESSSPQSYLKACIEPSVNEAVEKLSKQGGYRNPEAFILFNDTKVPYHCYTSEYYKTCMIQQPNLKSSFEKELSTSIEMDLKDCAGKLKEEYERTGYDVRAGSISSVVSLSPGTIEIKYDYPVTITKEVSQTYKGFNVDIESEMYDLLLLSTSILDFESTYGDSETTSYIQYYPDIKIEKSKLSDGSKIYRISNVVSKESYQFATRSLAWPSGYTGT